MATPPLKPGNDAPKSGRYDQVGPRGGNTGQVINIKAGKTLPPTDKAGQGYKKS